MTTAADVKVSVRAGYLYCKTGRTKINQITITVFHKSTFITSGVVQKLSKLTI